MPQFILKSIYAGRPLEAAYLKKEDVDELRRNPERLDEAINAYFRKTREINQLLAQGGHWEVWPSEGRDARVDAWIESNNARVRERDAALPDDQRIPPYYDKDGNPCWEDPYAAAEGSRAEVEGPAADGTPPG